MKHKVVALALLGSALVAGSVWAVDQDIDVFARMRVGLAFANKIDMNFTPTTGHIDFYGTPDPAVDFVKLGTDGAITVDGTILQPSALTGVPGSVEITSDGTSSVFIRCTTAATLAEPGALTLTVDQLQITMDTGTAFTAPDYVCDGLASVTPYSHTLDGTDQIIMGGRLVGAADMITALYDTTQTGGVPATVEVLYQ